MKLYFLDVYLGPDLRVAYEFIRYRWTVTIQTRAPNSNWWYRHEPPLEQLW